MPTPRDNPSGDARWDVGPEGEVAPGIRVGWNARSRIIICETHYTADPAKRTQEWYDGEHAGNSEHWDREYELAWRSYVGKSVYGATFGDIHIAKSLPYDPKRAILTGWDFGRDPCCIFGQLTVDGRLLIIGESIAPDRMSVDAFSRYYMAYVAERFGTTTNIKHCADPAGWAKGQQSDSSCIDELAKIGVRPQKGDIALTTRISKIEFFLKGLVGGQPQFQIDESKCPVLTEAFRGGYQFPKIHVQGGGTAWGLMPDKNKWSHPSDACQYLAALAKRLLIAQSRPQAPVDNSWRINWAGKQAAGMRRRAST